MNLSAPFLIDFFWDQMNKVLPYTDVIFCNEDEAAAFGKKMGWGVDLMSSSLTYFDPSFLEIDQFG
jgi:sugar/nucleoside kinase (ribokinase family)